MGNAYAVGTVTSIHYFEYLRRIQYIIGWRTIEVGMCKQHQWYTSLPYRRDGQFMIVVGDFMGLNE